MATYILSAELIARAIPAGALSTILTRSEVEGWSPDVTYYSGPGTTLTFKVDAETIDSLSATLRAISDTIEQAELDAR